jgi:hypothetical protein
MLKPGLRRVWRGPDTLQLGIDVPRPLVLQPVDDGVELWLRGLDGRLRLPELLALAPAAGLTEGEADRLLDRLATAGLLTDGALPDPVLAGLPLDLRDRIRPELTAVGLHDPRPDAAVVALRGRRALHVVVLSDDPVGALLAERLTEAGVGRVEEVAGLELPGSRAGVQHLLVLPSSTARSRRRDLAESSAPHLVTEVGETLVRLGPLVLPGRSACFGCLEQGRLDRDRGWAPVSAQLTGAPVEPGRTPLVHAAAALAALHVLDWCAGGLPPELDGVVEVGLPHGRAVRRACPPHPGCGCTWPSGTQHVTMTG